VPTRLLLEGHDLEALLAQVKKEHGPTAKIVSADRVRAAGLAGLFSRQRYELTVEVADKGEPASAAPATDATRPKAVPPTPPPESTPPNRPRTPPNPAAHFQAGLPSATLAYQANLAAAATGGTVPAAPNGAAPARVTVTPTDRSDPPAADSTTTLPVPVSTAAGAAASPADELVALVEERERRQTPYVGPDETASVSTAMRAAEQVSAEAAAFADVLSEYGIPGWRTPGSEGVMPSHQPESEQVVALFRAPEPPPEPTPGPPAERGVLVPRYRPMVLPADAPLVSVLTHLGMPKELCERVTGFDSYRAIVKVLKLLPGPPQPPAGAGDVLLIVGELTGAVATARTVTESLDLTPDRTLLAAESVAGTGIHTSRRLTGPEHAAKRIAKVREETDMPLIVVVDAPVGGTETARSIVEEIPATAVWGVVDATRKTADSARHLADIGSVDAIAVQGIGSTGDPATVLALGIPVALIDGVAPTPHLWADLLCRRLEEVVAE
jgi:hypothetical protein